MTGISTVLLVLPSEAQDLVPNGDFEQHTLCPDFSSQIDRCVGWSRPTDGTPDHYNACSIAPDWISMGVPDNYFGSEPAHSGNAYAGFFAFDNYDPLLEQSGVYREYVTHALATPLVPGETYAVEFFVSLSDRSDYATNVLGALFTTDIPYQANFLTIGGQPQVTSDPSIWLDDKTGWMRIAGCFTADSAYAYITLGNFRDTASTAAIHMENTIQAIDNSYYYIDDVSVEHLDRPDLGPDREACNEITLDVQYPIAGSTYVWSTGQAGPSITVNTSGTYWVTTDLGACPVSDTITVIVKPTVSLTLQADTVVDFCLEEVLVLGASALPPYAQVLWTTGDTSPTITVTGPGTYGLQASADGYCPNSAEVVVSDACMPPPYVPNVFTPDGDGINDTWRPVLNAVPAGLYEVIVYDRWGHPVCTLTDPKHAWDAADTPIGVYGYRLRIADTSGKGNHAFFGHVSVVR